MTVWALRLAAREFLATWRGVVVAVRFARLTRRRFAADPEWPDYCAGLARRG